MVSLDELIAIQNYLRCDMIDFSNRHKASATASKDMLGDITITAYHCMMLDKIRNFEYC